MAHHAAKKRRAHVDHACWRLLILSSLRPISKSSTLRPVFKAATNLRGCLPRPDHVSEVCGLRYLGKTLGYLRRGLPIEVTDCEASLPWTTSLPRLRKAFRFFC